MATILLGDIVQNIKEVVNPKTCGLDKFVGLEHYDAGEPMITRYGSPEKLDTNVKHFCKGDILVARRNVYLKRAGYVDFEGVTSGDSIVLRVTNPMYQRILPFILNTDDFWDYAEQNADGTMSKRLSPDDLLDYEFEEPEDKEVLAEKLWAAYRVKEAYRQLLSTTDDMLKAKFQEMFGDPFDCNVRSKVQLGSICTLNPRKTQKYDENTKVSFFPMDVVPEDGRSIELPSRLYKEVSKGFTFAEEGDVIFAKITPCMENGKGTILRNLSSKIGFGSTEFHVLRPIENVTTAEYLYVLISLPLFRKEAEKNMTGSGGQRRVPISFISDFFVAKPDFQKQKEFVSIYAQTETTKASLRASIEAIDRVIRSLINQ